MSSTTEDSAHSAPFRERTRALGIGAAHTAHRDHPAIYCRT